MLKITKAEEPILVSRLNLVLYGPPGIGKTSLAFTAETPLLLDFDNGAHRAVGRKDAVRVGEWSEVSDITAEDLAPYKTVVLDTAGRALDAITADIIKTDPKGHKNNALTLPGWGTLKVRFGTFLRLMNSFGKDVILVAHMDEQRSGDDLIERLDIAGGSKGEVYKAADAMGRLVIRNGQRQLLFSPTEAAFGKNPGQLPPLDVPHCDDPAFAGFLAKVIADTKSKLNAMSEAQTEAQSELEWFRETLPTITDAESINALIGRAKAAGRAASAMVAARAKELGLKGDRRLGAYVDPPSPETTEAA